MLTNNPFIKTVNAKGRRCTTRGKYSVQYYELPESWQFVVIRAPASVVRRDIVRKSKFNPSEAKEHFEALLDYQQDQEDIEYAGYDDRF